MFLFHDNSEGLKQDNLNRETRCGEYVLLSKDIGCKMLLSQALIETIFINSSVIIQLSNIYSACKKFESIIKRKENVQGFREEKSVGNLLGFCSKNEFMHLKNVISIIFP